MRFHRCPTRFCSPGLQDQHFPSIARRNLAQRPTWSYTVTANVSSARSDLIFWDHSIQCNLSDIHMSQKNVFSTIHNEWQHPSQKVGSVHSCGRQAKLQVSTRNRGRTLSKHGSSAYVEAGHGQSELASWHMKLKKTSPGGLNLQFLHLQIPCRRWIKVKQISMV